MSIRSLEYSNSGDCILIATGNAQARVVDRDGTEIFTCLKGDQYLFDLAKTHVRLTSDVPPIHSLDTTTHQGHVATINSATWHPSDRELFMTASSDRQVTGSYT